jgi:pimeloyl-ACP methyl ester carboxylesterase
MMTALNIDTKNDTTHLSWKLRLFIKVHAIIDRLSPDFATSLMMSKFVHPRRRKDSNYRARLPAGAKCLKVEHNGITLTGWSWGDHGPAVLLCHGWESHTGRMIPLIRPLLERGYRVFALDAPGHGLSPAVPTDLLDFGNAIVSMIQQHGPFHTIISHSFGAAATAVALAQQPGFMPKKLVLLAPVQGLMQHLGIFTQIAGLNPDQQSRLKARISTRIDRMPEEVSTLNAVSTLRIPGLIIHDCDDLLIPYNTSVQVAHHWHHASLVTTQGLGHRLILSDRRVMTHILDFVASEHTPVMLDFVAPDGVVEAKAS